MFDLILTSYNGILSLVLLVFAFLNTLVHISKFRSEGTYSFKAALVLFIPQTIFTVVRYILISFFQLAYIYVILWMDVILGIVLPTLIMCLLFIPTVSRLEQYNNSSQVELIINSLMYTLFINDIQLSLSTVSICNH